MQWQKKILIFFFWNIDSELKKKESKSKFKNILRWFKKKILTFFSMQTPESGLKEIKGKS